MPETCVQCLVAFRDVFRDGTLLYPSVFILPLRLEYDHLLRAVYNVFLVFQCVPARPARPTAVSHRDEFILYL